MLTPVIATSLIDPRIFGLAWYLLILIALVTLSMNGVRRRTLRVAPKNSLDGALLRLWLIALGPLLVISAISALQHQLAIGRIEILEMVLGGAVLLLAGSALQFNREQLPHGTALAAFGGLALSLYELVVLEQYRAGIIFQPINFGIACGVITVVLLSTLLNGLHKTKIEPQNKSQSSVLRWLLSDRIQWRLCGVRYLAFGFRIPRAHCRHSYCRLICVGTQSKKTYFTESFIRYLRIDNTRRRGGGMAHGIGLTTRGTVLFGHPVGTAQNQSQTNCDQSLGWTWCRPGRSIFRPISRSD